jgi:glucose-6-phosphate-specific signal transduction histidine kinase
MDDGLALDIRDDGRGLAPHAAEGFGLRAMRERVALLGGTMTLESGRGEGTTVAIALPCAGASSIPAVMFPPTSLGVSSTAVPARSPA